MTVQGRQPRAGTPSRFLAIAALAMLATSVAHAKSEARAGRTAYVPFATFQKSLSAAQPQAYVGVGGRAVVDAAAFAEMRDHLLRLYGGITVHQTFELGGVVFDCVPLMQQPAVRLQGLKQIATPPPPMQGVFGGGQRVQAIDGSSDAFGNSRHCAGGTIPMRRITLDEMTRFRTLRDFFRKSPGGDPLITGAPHDSNGHSYSVGSQTVDNYGGYDYVNVWRPYVDTSKGETFSLSQHWYVGGSGGSTQTAETGWQNFPGKYGTQDSVLFIYYTADGYQTTGCYNLECGAFVQTDSNWGIGGPFDQYSTRKNQREVALGYYLFNGNWWLGAGSDWVGYYPGSLYNGGQMASLAKVIEYGGEVCCVGTTQWPKMGSGKFAENGYGIAAYHRYILYRDSVSNGYNPSLSPYTPSPKCYTFAGPYYASDWLTYFYFGGPGKAAAKC